ncbi:MAG TPA: enoyl-CoA hydratase/isomerase family protein [Baekduia sp.]|uniref:enoyl-CoA hydratase/isomerase family protein n=1 Tax=Baekduia sp. TaxID=2600305 RepID=UPI002D790780|nr:enoyl-CoA hydratase/isomerase family protein [Baekduia sp.]HET6507911.1 enoyl-CoA hydratase/isomerase family protein [Baekduia sp.]
MITAPVQAELAFVEDDGIGIVYLDAGPSNVLSPQLLRAFMVALDGFEARAAKALVIASALPGVFASGGDVEHLSRSDSAGFVAYMHAIREALDRIAGLRVPSIAAIDGAAYGGGLELALACTLRVAGEGSRFGLPQIKLGVIPAAGGTQRLPRLVGHGKALDLLVTGRTVRVREAYEIGLVDRRASEGQGLAVALELARAIAAVSVPAVSAVRRAAEAAAVRSFPEGMAVEAREALALFEHGEAHEGIAAFLDKRPPDFA